MYCEGSKILENGSYEFETKSWGPPDLSLQNIAYQLQQQVQYTVWGVKNVVVVLYTVRLQCSAIDLH